MERPSLGTNENILGRGTDRHFYLPRLAREFYQGDAVVHWTMPMASRATGWLDETFHARFREIMLHAMAREGLICPVYCLMPDHIHLVWMGLKRDSDQLIGMKFLREHLGPALKPCRFQHQAHDHVLRGEDRKRGAFARICFYILANPIRAGLAKEGEAWPFGGTLMPGYPKFHPREPNFWPRFWKIFQLNRQPDVGERVLPIRGSGTGIANVKPKVE
jgi:putative transposase